MDKFKILVEGYVYVKDDTHLFASPSSVLVYSNNKKVLIDPGADKDKLLKGLSLAGLTTEDIDIIFLTHWHPDHFLNIQLFPNNDIYDATQVWKNTGEEFLPVGNGVMAKIPDTNIEILATPGHREEHVSLLINTEDLGKVCIAADVFWWMDNEQPANPSEDELMNLQDPYLANISELKQSRKKILEVADWIIPGHGKMFKNPRKNR